MARKKKELDQTRAIGYIRVSTDEQHLGPEAQRDALARWCETEGVELVAVFEDKSVSGGAPIEKRPALLDVLNALSDHNAGVLLVQKRDRLARKITVAGAIEGYAESKGARVVTTEGDEGDDPNAWLLRTMKDMLAEFERIQIKARTSTAMAVKKARGERVGQIPFGYRLAVDGQKLEADPDEQHVVELVKSLRAEGMTLTAIADHLNRKRVPARGRKWYPMTVSRVLNREKEAA